MSDGRRLLAALLTVVLASLLASRVLTSGGRVRVRDIEIPTENGQWLVADLFRPVTATAEAPAPFVAVVPGFQRSKEALANIALELARRGFVVACIDPYAQGRSSASTSRRSATAEGYGLFALLNYVALTPHLNYVDKTRIGATGHSAGGNAVIAAASHFGRAGQRSGKPPLLHSVFVSGYVLSFTADMLADVRSNVGTSYALFDEGAYRNELGTGDMRRAPEALRLVNSGRAPGEPPVAEVVPGRYYGEAGTRTLRVVHNERTLHPFQPYDVEATASQIEYFERVFGVQSGLSPRDQVWYWRELLGLIALGASLLALVPLGRLLLRLPFFAPLVQPVPEALPPPRGAGVAVFWGMVGLGALIACGTYIPMAELSQKLFVAASGREMTWFFPQRMNNAVMLWAVLNGSLGFALFYFGYRFHGRHNGARPELWGAQTSPAELARTLALAASLASAYYLLLFAIYYFFHVDYRFLFMGVRPFQPELLLLLAMYAPFLFVFFLSNSLRVNGAMRFEGQAEWRSLLLAGFANSLGLLLIVVVQYATFAATGRVFWTESWLYVNLLFAVVPMMFFLPLFNRWFFRMTGRIYLGPLVTCLVFVMMLISNTVIYLPL
ncbi:MAG: alpha/beta hydrolase [Vicinamibacteria bacterium]|nr:alpha/beta hydrolase [Vicinamibacteria bacterium]